VPKHVVVVISVTCAVLQRALVEKYDCGNITQYDEEKLTILILNYKINQTL